LKHLCRRRVDTGTPRPSVCQFSARALVQVPWPATAPTAGGLAAEAVSPLAAALFSPGALPPRLAKPGTARGGRRHGVAARRIPPAERGSTDLPRARTSSARPSACRPQSKRGIAGTGVRARNARRSGDPGAMCRAPAPRRPRRRQAPGHGFFRRGPLSWAGPSPDPR
jgi:hypothetical protein